jgi:hypothetical protein
MRVSGVVLLLAVAVGCGEDGDRTAVDGGPFRGRTYRLDEPEGWTRVERPQLKGIDLILGSPREGPRDPFVENVNMVLENVPPGMSVDEYFSRSRKNLEKKFALRGPITSSEREIPAGTLHVTHFRHRYQSYDLVVDSCVFIAGRACYIMTCTALEQTYERYRPTFEKTVASFRLD